MLLLFDSLAHLLVDGLCASTVLGPLGGSCALASLILLMLWLYMICQAIFVGAALNIALRDRRALKNKT